MASRAYILAVFAMAPLFMQPALTQHADGKGAGDSVAELSPIRIAGEGPSSHGRDTTMIRAQDVVDLEQQLRHDLTRDQLEALLVVAADGLEQTYLHRVTTYNRLYTILGDIIERLVAADRPALLKELMNHPHPKVFHLATARYYWDVNADEAEAAARAIAAANPESTPLGREARKALQAYERNRKWGNTPSARAAETPRPPFTPPPEPPAILKAVDREKLREMTVAAGCEALLPILPRLAWPSIRLARTPLEADNLPVGTSKLGGSPDMPDSVDWPRFQGNPLSFIGQVALADIAQYRDFTRLPESGHLLFFYDADLQPWGHEDLEPGSSQVLYIQPNTPLTRRPPPPDVYEELQYRPARLAFLEDVTLPNYDIGPMNEGPSFGPLALSEEQHQELNKLRDILADHRAGDNQPIHRMFGYQDEWQDSMFLASEYGSDEVAERRRLLLQVDSDYVETATGDKGMYWGSEGRLFYWGRRSDLPRGLFDAIKVILQCT